MVDLLVPPRGASKFMKIVLLLDDSYVKVVSYGENSERLYTAVKDSKVNTQIQGRYFM